MKETKQYGNSPRGKGRSPELDQHKGPVARDQEHYSQMRKTDAKEQHLESKSNMEATPKKSMSQELPDKHPYKHQSHWGSPSKEVKSVVGDGTNSGHPGRYTSHPDEFGGSMDKGEYHRGSNVTEVKRPDIDGDYDDGKDQKHIQTSYGVASSSKSKSQKEPNNSMGSDKSSYQKYKEDVT